MKELTKKEAQELLLTGQKLTHKYFMEDEYIYIDNEGRLRDEKDLLLDPFEFWYLRSAVYFDNGWSKFEDK